MSLSYSLLKAAGESQDRLSRDLQAEYRTRTCEITSENMAIFKKNEEENWIRRQRRYLQLNAKPAAAVIISDPELRNNEKSGYMDV